MVHLIQKFNCTMENFTRILSFKFSEKMGKYIQLLQQINENHLVCIPRINGEIYIQLLWQINENQWIYVHRKIFFLYTFNFSIQMSPNQSKFSIVIFSFYLHTNWYFRWLYQWNWMFKQFFKWKLLSLNTLSDSLNSKSRLYKLHINWNFSK